MPDRLSRPPVKLQSAQPDGTLNGLGRAAQHFLGQDQEQHRFLVLEVGLDELRHKMSTGADVAVLTIVKVAMPADQQTLAEMLSEALAADFEGTVPAFPITDRGRYEAALDVWAEKQDLGPADVRQEWEKHFGSEVPGPAGAETAHLAEFVLEVAGAYLTDTSGEADDVPDVDTSGGFAAGVHDAQVARLEKGRDADAAETEAAVDADQEAEADVPPEAVGQAEAADAAVSPAVEEPQP